MRNIWDEEIGDEYDDPSEMPGSAIDAIREGYVREALEAKRMQTPVGNVFLGEALTNAVDAMAADEMDARRAHDGKVEAYLASLPAAS
jgi:hypothetical protein